MFTVIFTVFKLLGSVVSGIFTEKAVAIQAQAAVETAAIQGAAQVETRWWFVAALIPTFAIPFAIYDAKAVLWDNVIMNGTASTPPLHGDLSWVHLTVVGGLFLHWMIKS